MRYLFRLLLSGLGLSQSPPAQTQAESPVGTMSDCVSATGKGRVAETEPAVVLRFQWDFADRRIPLRSGMVEGPEMAAMPDEVLHHSPTVLELGATYFTWSINQRIECFLPADRRVYSRRDGDEDWEAYSLLALISFRVNELQNRQGLGELFGKLNLLKLPSQDGASLPGQEEFAAETSLGIQIPSNEGGAVPPTEVETVVQDDTIEFRHLGKVWVEMEPSDHEIPARCQHSWRLFLTHCCHLHPAIRERILLQPCFPRRITYRVQNAPRETETVLRLEEVSEQEPRRELPTTYRFGGFASTADALARCLESLKTRKLSTPSEAYQRAEGLVRYFSQEGRAVDGLLSAFEFEWHTGASDEQKQRLMSIVGSVINEDFDATRILKSCGANTPDACRAAVAYFDSLDKSLLRKGYLLDVFAANNLENAGETQEAEQRYLKVLSVNPELAGVWCDLGQNYHQSYRHMEAWHCFEAARRIAPRYSLLKVVDSLEACLLRDFAKYF